MVADHTLYLVSHCTDSGAVRYFQELGTKSDFLNNIWWWLQHRWYARPKATQVFQIAIPTIIAGAAFLVAWSQREIAANKYRMDLYDKRSPAIAQATKNEQRLIAPEDLTTADFTRLKETETTVSHLRETFPLFSDISLVEIDKRYSDLMKNVDRFLGFHLGIKNLEEEYNNLRILIKKNRETIGIAQKINFSHIDKFKINESIEMDTVKELQIYSDIKTLREKITDSKNYIFENYAILHYLISEVDNKRKELWYLPNNPYHENNIDKLFRKFLR